MSKLEHAPQVPRRSLIAVIGDAKLKPDSHCDRLSEEIGRLLVDNGYRILTGGLGGVMESACRGARKSQRYSPGDTVGLLPGHDPADANEFVDVAIASGLDHVRNSIVAHADAVIAIGGGAGTLSEICFAWMYKRLIIALQVEGWSGRIADQRLDNRTRYPAIPDDRIFGASEPREVIQILAARLPDYHGQFTGIRRRKGNG